MQNAAQPEVNRKFVGRLEGTARAADLATSPDGTASITITNQGETVGFIGLSPQRTHLSILYFPERPYTEHFQMNARGTVSGRRSHTGASKKERVEFESKTSVDTYFTEAQRALDQLTSGEEVRVCFDFSEVIPGEYR